jgi:hypothetical protein
MSGISRKKVQVPREWIDFSLSIIHAEDPFENVRKNKDLIDGITPSEVIALVDELVALNLPMPQLKKGINKLLNLFNLALKNYPVSTFSDGSFPDVLIRNNYKMSEDLKS